MAWDWGIVLAIIGIIVTILVGIPPLRRHLIPPVIFAKPDPRDHGPQRWWHVPVHIERPNNEFVAFFTKTEIPNCHAEVVIREWNRVNAVMRWESDNLSGKESVTLEYHPRQTRPLIKVVPIAIRRSEAGKCFKSIDLDRGETYLTEINFVHHGIKTKDALLENGKKYSLVLKLWSPAYRRFSESKEYSLVVPKKEDSNEAFILTG